jgi:glutamyl-tRNA synthetase
VFSYDKLKWMNGMYLRRTPDAELASLIEPFLVEAGLAVDRATLVAILPYIRERLQTSLLDAVPLVEFLFREPVITPDLFAGIALSREDLVRALDATHREWASAGSFEPAALEGGLKQVIETVGLDKKPVMMAIRLGATGRKATPPLFESLSVLGRERTLGRLARARDVLAA